MPVENKNGMDKYYPPSRFVVDEKNQKWRLCAGCAVLNSNHELLVGERITVEDPWQAPQGGVDGASEYESEESVFEAACRELYEEMGLISGTHVIPIELHIAPVRYEIKGTSEWLSNAGFSGQELHWNVFRCIDGPGDSDPFLMCSLAGENGEEAEFTGVKWAPLSWIIDNMSPNKRLPYEKLRDALEPTCCEWKSRCAALDFSGKWSRDASQCTGVVEALVARGLTLDDAQDAARHPYVQSFSRRSPQTTTWKVTSFHVDGTSIRRVLDYKVGPWEEPFPAGAVILGRNTQPARIKRRTAFVAEPRADGGIAHSTISQVPNGFEESRRFLKNGNIMLERSFWPIDTGLPVVSMEVFLPYEHNA